MSKQAPGSPATAAKESGCSAIVGAVGAPRITSCTLQLTGADAVADDVKHAIAVADCIHVPRSLVAVLAAAPAHLQRTHCKRQVACCAERKEAREKKKERRKELQTGRE